MRDYKVRFAFPADLEAVYRDVFQLDVRLQNVDDSWHLPVPATFVINQDRTVVAADVDPDYRRRLEPGDILTVLDRLS